MDTTQWDRLQSLLVQTSKFEPALTVETLYNDVHERQRHHLASYKKDIYEMLSDSDKYKRVVRSK